MKFTEFFIIIKIDNISLLMNDYLTLLVMVIVNFQRIFTTILADRTAIHYDRLLASSSCASVCLSVTLCIVALKIIFAQG